MARIPDEELERLKHEVSLARLIEAQGLSLTSQGKDLACRCPWHEGDDTPSCIVSRSTRAASRRARSRSGSARRARWMGSWPGARPRRCGSCIEMHSGSYARSPW